MDLKKLACSCNGVSYGMIVQAVDEGARTFEQVQERTHCSRGCGRCQEFIQSFVLELVAEKSHPTDN